MRCTLDIRFGTVTYHSPLPTVLVLGHRSRNPELERLDPAREARGGGPVGRPWNGDGMPREPEVPFEGAAARREHEPGAVGRGGGRTVGTARNVQRAGVREPRLQARVRVLLDHVTDAGARGVGGEVIAQLIVDRRRGDPRAHQDEGGVDRLRRGRVAAPPSSVANCATTGVPACTASMSSSIPTKRASPFTVLTCEARSMKGNTRNASVG